MNVVLIIPHFNHISALEAFLPRVLGCGVDKMIIVDDGSHAQTYSRLKQLVQDNERITLLRHEQNRGKGAAVRTGCQYARLNGFTHAVQMDADGQHAVSDVSKLLAVSHQYPNAIVSGKPFFDDSAPKARVYGRRISEFWAALETLSWQIKDALCGFRVYPLAVVETVSDRYFLGPRMDFDTEILVKSIWAGFPVLFVDTKVVYPERGVSHFHYWRDNLLLIRLHTRLMLGMFLQAPRLLWRKLNPLRSARPMHESLLINTDKK